MRLPSATALSLQPADASRERLQTAARELESQFAQMMLKSMRSASLGDPLLGDNTMYRDMYDQQLAKEMTKGRGLGLAPMIEQQLSRSLPAASPATNVAIDLDRSIGTVMRPGPIALMQNLPLPMALDAGGAGVGALGLAPSRSGVSLPAVAPQPLPVPETPEVAEVGTNPGAKLDCSSPEAFVRSIWPQAKETARELGVSAKALVAQAALETGWGRRLVGGDKSHNLFGIKSTGSWRGARVESATHEFVDGKRQNQRAHFRAYDSVQQSFADYAKLMRNERYSGAIAAGEDPVRFASALQKAGYATDPSYAAKISAIANGPTLQRALGALELSGERAYAALPRTTPRG
ncbi:flagellar assembly peptidoglycan hydrolase FlgJ [Lysobacter ciconiae]|uniref:Peptidoglycan hydrolase FlgJ n=1 Tax=Novilysobacter ciconiae TaxID=2781022 RepID=A0A7S6UGZ8_9GAMM|nr:flagellar assembly peptidoglycan hydrolase FlgJ [Lysobacter ciconiae]QOW20128.1 flagellar assembly peptidoglycan hydrolase FlgJ [Lysobacter ciconiae]